MGRGKNGCMFRKEKEYKKVNLKKDEEGSFGLSLDKAQGVWHWDSAL